MTIKLNKTTSPSELANQLKPAKRLDTKKYAGKLTWGQNALDYQRQLRDE